MHSQIVWMPRYSMCLFSLCGLIAFVCVWLHICHVWICAFVCSFLSFFTAIISLQTADVSHGCFLFFSFIHWCSRRSQGYQFVLGTASLSQLSAELFCFYTATPALLFLKMSEKWARQNVVHAVVFLILFFFLCKSISRFQLSCDDLLLFLLIIWITLIYF